jgi:hypothetical protein
MSRTQLRDCPSNKIIDMAVDLPSIPVFRCSVHPVILRMPQCRSFASQSDLSDVNRSELLSQRFVWRTQRWAEHVVPIRHFEFTEMALNDPKIASFTEIAAFCGAVE